MVLEEQLTYEEAEKKYLWRALKAVKSFLKKDEAFENLVVMLNEFVILLEQLLFIKKNVHKKLGTLALKDQDDAQKVISKLKVVEADIKSFKLPVNVQSMIP